MVASARAGSLVLVLAAAMLAGCSESAEPEPACDPFTDPACPGYVPPPPQPAPTAPAPAPEPKAPRYPHFPNDGSVEVTDLLIPSPDGHEVPATIHKPTVANATQPVPVLLHSHGFGDSRVRAETAFEEYIAAGFAVVSFDMRGHGDARDTSFIRVLHVDYEIQDVLAVIDHMASLDWVLKDGDGDPRMGALGGSYGGGYQLLAAALDDRLDALAPETTWHDLPQSLVPNGAPKSAWIDLLYANGNYKGRFHEDIHRGYTWLQTTNEMPDGSDPGEPDLKTAFTVSSSKSYAEAIDVPTFLYSGVSDTLFNANEAVDNYEQIKATGAAVRLYTHLDGHILHTDGTLPSSPIPIGLQAGPGGKPCGDATKLNVEWYLQRLLDVPSVARPNVCWALDDGSALNATTFPLPFAVAHKTPLEDDLVVTSGTKGVTVEKWLFEAPGPMAIAGIPRLGGTATSPAPDAIVYWSLKVVAADGTPRTANGQITPQRFLGGVDAEPFRIDMMGVGVRLHEGDKVYLVASDRSDQFLHNEPRVLGPVTYRDVEVTLPLVALQ